jgi:hypothetical protein
LRGYLEPWREQSLQKVERATVTLCRYVGKPRRGGVAYRRVTDWTNIRLFGGGDCLLWPFLKITKVSQIIGLHSSTEKVMY